MPNYSIEVIEACSGLRSLMTLSALGATMAYITQRKLTFGIIFFLMTVPIAICANIFRIFFTAICAVLINHKFAESFLHNLSGVFVFLLGFLLLTVTGIVLKKIDFKLNRIKKA